MKGGPLGDIKNICVKVSSSQKKPAQKSFGHGRDSNPHPSAWQTSKTILINLYAKRQQKLQMWQLVDAAYKAYEICHFVGPKKKKKSLRKAPTKNSVFNNHGTSPSAKYANDSGKRR